MYHCQPVPVLKDLSAVCCALAPQVLDHYKKHVVKLQAEKPQEEVTKAIRNALSKIKEQ
jgi:hypothetical protein